MSHVEHGSGGGGESLIVESFVEVTQSLWDLLGGIITGGILFLFSSDSHH